MRVEFWGGVFTSPARENAVSSAVGAKPRRSDNFYTFCICWRHFLSLTLCHLQAYVISVLNSSSTKDMPDVTTVPGGPKKRPELSHGITQQSRWNKSAEKHICNEQTSSNKSMNFHLKCFHISRDTSEIVLHVIKQCLQAVCHLCCWLYAGYTKTPQ